MSAGPVSRTGQRMSTFLEDWQKAKDLAANYWQGVKEGRWATPGQRSTDSGYDPIRGDIQATTEAVKAATPTFGTDWDKEGAKQDIQEGRYGSALARLGLGTAGAALDAIDPGAGHALTTSAAVLIPAAKKIVGPGGKEIAVSTGRRLEPEFKAEMDIRRKYQGEQARTHPADWNYQLGKDQPTTVPVQDFDINQLRSGDTLHAFPGDRSRVSAPLVEVQGKRLPAEVSAEGGSDYMRTPGGVWASDRGIISRQQNQATASTGTPYGLTVAMGPTSINYSHHAWEPLLWQMQDAPASKTAREAFDKEFRKKNPGWPGIDKTEESLHYLQSEKTTARSPFVELLQKGKYQKQGFPEPGPVRWAMTEPDLRRVDTGSTGYGVSRLEPGAKVIPDPGHTDYNTGLAGTYAGRLGELLPYTEVFRDWAARPDVQRLPPSKESNRFYKFQKDLPVQTVDQELVDFMGRRIERAKRGD
jgi:hypothetical protein